MKRYVLLFLLLFLVGCSSPSTICGDGRLDKGETAETCCIDAGCDEEGKVCELGECVDPSCEECQYLEDGVCYDYMCCSNEDCLDHEICVDNICEFFSCDEDCEYKGVHGCFSYTCCSDEDCDDGNENTQDTCLNPKTEDAECDYIEIEEEVEEEEDETEDGDLPGFYFEGVWLTEDNLGDYVPINEDLNIYDMELTLNDDFFNLNHLFAFYYLDQDYTMEDLYYEVQGSFLNLGWTDEGLGEYGFQFEKVFENFYVNYGYYHATRWVRVRFYPNCTSSTSCNVEDDEVDELCSGYEEGVYYDVYTSLQEAAANLPPEYEINYESNWTDSTTSHTINAISHYGISANKNGIVSMGIYLFENSCYASNKYDDLIQDGKDPLTDIEDIVFSEECDLFEGKDYMGEVYLIDKMGYCIKENVIYYMVGSGYSMMTEWEDIYNFLNDVEQGIDWEY